MTDFRVHFTDGTKITVAAKDAKAAAADALKKHSGHVSKVKVVREQSR